MRVAPRADRADRDRARHPGGAYGGRVGLLPGHETEDIMAVYIVAGAARVAWRGEYAAALAWVARRGLGERVERVGGVL